MNDAPPRDLVRTFFQLLALGGLIGTSLWIARPFLVPLAWATMIAVATWPLLAAAERVFGGRRMPAVALLTLLLALTLLVPGYLCVDAVASNADALVRWSRSLASLSFPPLPEWVAGLPVVGAKLAERWQQLSTLGGAELATRLAPYAQRLVLWLVGAVGNAGLLLLQFLLTVIVTAILYANGETAARGALRFGRRLAGEQGENALRLAAQAVRGVALGVVVTALLQASLSGVGLAVAGVPFASILTGVMFVLAIAQIGPALVLIPSVFWVFSTQGAVWGTGFLVWALFCGTFDNFVRPLLIRRGADLPLLLIFSGVIGGLVAFGVIGLFVGPVALAVAWTLLADWVERGEAEAA